MTQIIPLTKIGFFNPGRLTDEEIEQSFIARIPFFEFIFKKIIAEKPNSIPQHHLIIGQRGMGKTSLLVRIAAELRKPPYVNSFIPLSFPEEQYNLDRLSKFWLNCLDAFADALDKEHNTSFLKEVDDKIASLSKGKDVDANTIYKIFEKLIKQVNRRPVLLVDNLNLIFAKLNKEEQHQLRAILMSKGAPVLVGASANVIDETVNYQAPFYDSFQINYLKKLTFDESLEVLLNLAKITGNSDFQNTIYLQRGRIQALYQLTGGTPRTLSILFPLIQDGFSQNIQTDLDALLDIVTPLYKARFEELAPQLQVVLDAVALHWDPINIEQLREITLLENSQLSPQLKRLTDVGWLQKLEAYNAKGGAFELSERFFNIWYLMRRSSRRQKRELYCLTKFLESFYGNQESDKYEEAEHAYKKAISINENNSDAWNELGQLYQNFLHKYEDAELAYLKSLKIDPSNIHAKYNLIFLWRDELNKLEEAKELFNSITEAQQFKTPHLLNRALFAFYEKNVGIAEDFLKQALSTVENDISNYWYRTVAVIFNLGFQSSLLSIFKETGNDIVLKPFYIAIEALTKNEDELYFNSIAAEVREPAKKIRESIRNYLK